MSFHQIQAYPPFSVPISYKDWAVNPREGAAGSLGILKKLTSPDGAQSVMIKKFVNPFENTDRARCVLRELNLLRTISHDHIVRFLGSYTVNDGVGESIYHVTAFCGEPLEKKINEGRYSMEDVKKWIAELVQVLQHLHSNGAIFRNLHPRNICIDANNKLTLTGFGKARAIDRANNMTSDRGTQPYMPLELLVDWIGPYDEKVDIWTIGALLCELITGQPLFTGPQVKNSLKKQMEYCGGVPEHVLNNKVSSTDRVHLAKYSNIERKDFITILRETMQPGRIINETHLMANEEPLRDFIEHTLQFDPDMRMSAERALSHRILRPPRSWEQTESAKASVSDIQELIQQEIDASAYRP